MQKAGNMIRQYIVRLLLLLTGGQIVLGLLWLCANMGGYQAFRESAEVIDAARTWKLDEYVGILYPVVVRCVQMIGGWFHFSFLYLLYAIQLSAAFLGGAWMLYWLMGEKASDNRFPRKARWLNGKTIYGSLYLLTIPMLLQCHMAVLPQSVALTLLYLLTGQSLKLMRRREKGGLLTDWAMLGILWTAAALTLPEYAWIGSIFPLACLTGRVWEAFVKRREMVQNAAAYRRGIVAALLVLIVGAAGIWGIQKAAIEPGSRGKMVKTLGAAAMRRIVWPNFGKDSYFWIEPVWQVFDEKELSGISLNPESVIDTFGPVMENAYGVDRANEIYWNMAGNTFRVRTKEIAADIGLDYLAYSCPQISLLRNLEGEGVTLAGWNYGRMNEKSPVLTNYYMDYSLAGFAAAMVLVLAAAVIRFAGILRKKAGGIAAEDVKTAALCIVVCQVLTVWYTLSAGGMQDYRNVLYCSAIWAVPILVCTLKRTDRSGIENETC